VSPAAQPRAYVRLPAEVLVPPTRTSTAMTRRPKATDARRVTRLALELMVLQSKLSGNPQDPNDKLPTTCQCDESASARHCSFCPDSPMALAPRTRRPSDSRTSRGNDFGDVGRLGRIHRLEPRHVAPQPGAHNLHRTEEETHGVSPAWFSTSTHCWISADFGSDLNRGRAFVAPARRLVIREGEGLRTRHRGRVAKNLQISWN